MCNPSSIGLRIADAMADEAGILCAASSSERPSGWNRSLAFCAARARMGMAFHTTLAISRGAWLDGVARLRLWPRGEAPALPSLAPLWQANQSFRAVQQIHLGIEAFAGAMVTALNAHTAAPGQRCTVQEWFGAASLIAKGHGKTMHSSKDERCTGGGSEHSWALIEAQALRGDRPPTAP